RPLASAIVVDGVDIIITGDQRAFDQRLAGTRRQVPPPFRGPALLVLVAERNADPAACVVAQSEIRHRVPREGKRPCQRKGGKQGSPGVEKTGPEQGGPNHGNRKTRAGHTGLSTTMARKSLTFVKVGPGRSRPPARSKNPVESLSARNAAGSRPSARAFAAVCPSLRAPPGPPAAPPPPSVPSVSAASAAMPVVPASAMASASAYSWFGPPRPFPRIVTVSSPPDRITAPPPAARNWRASCACAAATSRASPSSRSPRNTTS